MNNLYNTEKKSNVNRLYDSCAKDTSAGET